MPAPIPALTSRIQQATHPFTSEHEPAFLTASLPFFAYTQARKPSLLPCRAYPCKSTPHFLLLDKLSKASHGH